MSVGTVISRATGLLRITAIVAALGVVEDRVTDTYNLANTAPNIIYELVLGGILTSVFVPVFVELLEKEGRERAWEVVSAIVNLSIVALTAIAVIGILAAPLISKLYALRFAESEAALQRETLTFLLRLFIPQIIFYGLAAITAGLLNAHRRFAAPMYTPILNNLAVIAIFVAFRQAYGAVSLEELTTPKVLLIGLGTTAGVAIMALAQLPFLKGVSRYRFAWDPTHPSVKKLMRLSVYVIGYVMVNQIGYLIVQLLAAPQQGGYSAYVYAFTFFMLPHGLFAVSVITALLPAMSEHAVHERWDQYRSHLSIGMRATILLVLPAAIGYLVLGEPIVRLLIEYGRVTSASTELLSDVLQLFVLGLVPFALFQLFLRGFYALHDTKTPFLINCGAVALNTAINIPMFAVFEVKGLAAGHAIAYSVGAVLQGRALSRRVGGIDGREVARSAVRIATAGAGMGALVWLSARLVSLVVQEEEFVGAALMVAVPVGVGVLSYLGLAHLFRVRELDFVRGVLARRRGNPSKPQDTPVSER